MADFKSTLNLPKTDFAMKADLPKREPGFLAQWEKMGLYKLFREKKHPRGSYILHDGPPYANGNIHIGHALNKTLKDIVVKYKTMQGFDSPYIPGWDCHGLPVEHQLFKELKINKYQIDQVEFRKKAHDYAMRYVAIQREDFKRLGVFGEWENPYLTLSHEYEEAIVASFARLVTQGYIYRGLKPVNWCYRCETALAEAEVEYEDHTSPTAYVKFKMHAASGFPQDCHLVIWTTTPWTLIANVAVAVNPDFTYAVVKTDKGNLIIATVRLGILDAMGIVQYTVLKEVKGSALEGLTYDHPFGLRKGKVVLASYVSAEEGTGLVHTAPGHGAEDYATGIKYKLEIVMPVDSKGNFDASAGELKGCNVHQATDAILEKLQQSGLLLLSEKLRHSYPHCWRCKNPIIFRATNQWFLGVDHKGLRQRALDTINKDIVFVPPAGKERIASMVELRPDWCLSRQRYWGVPIPSLLCTKCGHEFLDAGAIERYRSFVENEGTDCWFIRPVADFLPPGLRCQQCQSTEFKKGTDILDVWFDSGVSHQAVLKKRAGLAFPCDLYLEGSDQHRGWFQSSLIPALCIEGSAPFKSVLTHGHVVDGDGRKMSKSLGNVISPQDIIKHNGADIVRLWVASTDYNEDIRISEQILLRLIEAYRKIRNTAKFMLSNLYDFVPERDLLAYPKLQPLDKWIVARVVRVIETVQGAYDAFEFYRAYKCLYDFCNEDLSMYYLDMVKGRLYTQYASSLQRRGAQTALYEIVHALARMVAPIMVFTAEDIWQHVPKTASDAKIPSVHLLSWPSIQGVSAGDAAQLDAIIQLIPVVTKALEEKRVAGLIGSSFDAKINLLTNSEIRYTYLKDLEPDLPEVFKVSGVAIQKVGKLPNPQDANGTAPEISVEVLKADGTKCERCWNFSVQGKEQEGLFICEKCRNVLRQNP